MNRGFSIHHPSLGRLTHLMKWLVIGLALAPQLLPACAVPVFRYALERWPAADYEVSVVGEGGLDERGREMLARLAGREVPRGSWANVTVRPLDPRAHALAGLPGAEKLPPPGQGPAIVLRYPEEAAPRGVVWSGPFSEANLGQLLDSPMRRHLVQRLVSGDSAVWILLESGDPEPDNAAARRLQTRLEHAQRTLTLPQPESAADPADLMVANELKVAFSLLRLARDDPAEAVLVRLLLGSEDDLNETREPLAFPIYGRGRILYALVGQGINPETIDEACAFLTGPCSCVIKEQNPGVDLLLTADWDRLVPRTAGLEASELASLLGHPSSSGPGGPKAAVSTSAKARANGSAARLPGQAHFDTRTVLKPTLILLGGLSSVVLAIGCGILWRKRD